MLLIYTLHLLLAEEMLASFINQFLCHDQLFGVKLLNCKWLLSAIIQGATEVRMRRNEGRYCGSMQVDWAGNAMRMWAHTRLMAQLNSMQPLTLHLAMPKSCAKARNQTGKRYGVKKFSSTPELVMITSCTQHQVHCLSVRAYLEDALDVYVSIEPSSIPKDSANSIIKPFCVVNSKCSNWSDLKITFPVERPINRSAISACKFLCSEEIIGFPI